LVESLGRRDPDGALFGTLMLANVWRVIWPNQKIVIASAVAAATGGQANPAAAAAGRRAFLASRTNVVFSVPMLFFMGAATHMPPNPITHLMGTGSACSSWPR